MDSGKVLPRFVMLVPAVLLMVAVTGSAAGATGHGAHVHGQSRLDVVLEGDAIELQLSGPAFNFVGFEHNAEGAVQRAALTAARSQLGQPALLFTPSAAAGCTGETLSLDTGDAHAHVDDAGHDGDHQDHGDAPLAGGHRHEHEAHEHDEGGPASTAFSPKGAHEQDAGGSHSHRDWQARYRFTCSKPEAIEAIEVALFEYFPDTLQIDFQLIGPTVTGGRLDIDNRILNVQ